MTWTIFSKDPPPLRSLTDSLRHFDPLPPHHITPAFIWDVRAAIYLGDWAGYDHLAAVDELHVCWEKCPHYLSVVISNLISSTLRQNFVELPEEFRLELL